MTGFGYFSVNTLKIFHCVLISIVYGKMSVEFLIPTFPFLCLLSKFLLFLISEVLLWCPRSPTPTPQYLSFFEFVELLRSLSQCFSPNLGIFWPLFLRVFSAQFSHIVDNFIFSLRLCSFFNIFSFCGSDWVTSNARSWHSLTSSWHPVYC